MYERMLDKNVIPSLEEMASYCGELSNLFLLINKDMLDKTKQDIVFPYGNNYGWAVSHKVKSKLICNIFPESNAFTVMIRLTNKQFDSVYNQLSKYSQDYIDHKYPCNEGGWIHYRVLCEEHLKDIQKLIAIKIQG